MGNSNTIKYIFFGAFAAILVFIIGLAFYASMFGYQIIDGRLVGMDYTSAHAGVFVSAGSQSPGTAQVFTPEKFTLLIDAAGHVTAYSVSVDTYALALSGQTVFKMKCNKIQCIVLE